jgi:putative GTP pyrophosphokinase
MASSKGDIDRLGNLIRSEQFLLKEDTLVKLQEYRTSHQDTLSTIFTILCSYIRKIHPTSIVTYRIKRFESIIGKLMRYPEMRFSRMWDIGGCRFIVRDSQDVYKMKSLLEKDSRISIVKEYDYIKEPQEDGYRSLHLFIKCADNDKTIEVQIRSLQDHNWATLVEITDVLYDLKIKELGNSAELGRFHFLLSKISELTIDEKKEIAKILTKYRYFEKLSEVFSRNYLKVRQQWFDIENLKNHRYFLIETNKEATPKIFSYKNSVEAEVDYLNFYRTTGNANIVLTHLPDPSYHQISIAYSNYILTFHSFLEECYEILESLIVEALEQGKYHDYFTVLRLYHSLLFEHVRNLMTEIREMTQHSEIKHQNNRRQNRKKHSEWITDIQREINKNNVRIRRLSNKIGKNMPDSTIGKFTVRKITSFIGNKYQGKIKKQHAISATHNK